LIKSALYVGQVSHERAEGPERKFTNRIMMPLVFLDEVDSLRLAPLWSRRFPSIIHWRRDDFFGENQSLEESVKSFVDSQLGFRPAGPVAQLAHHRTWGWLFNPIALYYCFDQTGQNLEAVVASVSNTPWGETHNYAIDTRNGVGDLPLQAKAMHVSPFLPMDLDYRFRLSAPNERLAFSVSVLRGTTQVFRAGMTMRRVPLTRRRLAWSLLAYPLQTFRVSEGIYREALVLAIRRAKFYTHPKKKS
jgi:DUF1365 family protein